MKTAIRASLKPGRSWTSEIQASPSSCFIPPTSSPADSITRASKPSRTAACIKWAAVSVTDAVQKPEATSRPTVAASRDFARTGLFAMSTRRGRGLVSAIAALRICNPALIEGKNRPETLLVPPRLARKLMGVSIVVRPGSRHALATNSVVHA